MSEDTTITETAALDDTGGAESDAQSESEGGNPRAARPRNIAPVCVKPKPNATPCVSVWTISRKGRSSASLRINWPTLATYGKTGRNSKNCSTSTAISMWARSINASRTPSRRRRIMQSRRANHSAVGLHPVQPARKRVGRRRSRPPLGRKNGNAKLRPDG